MLELIYCMMLQSANEAAATVADYYGREAFIEKMNQQAAELGCRETHFSNVHGVFVDNHYTTAYDTYLITKWALGIPLFWEISQQSRYEKRETNKNAPVTLVTTNAMQDRQSRYYTDYIRGVKTGTLEEAGRCLVTVGQKNGMTLLLILLGAPFSTSDRIRPQGDVVYTETRICYDWAFEHLTLRNIVNTETAVFEVKMRFAAHRDNILLYPDGALYALTPTDRKDDRQVEYIPIDVPEVIQAPVQNRQFMGRARVLYGGEEIGVIDLVTHEAIERDTFVMVMDILSLALSSTVAKVFYVVVLGFGLFYIYFTLVVMRRSPKKRNQRIQKRRRARSRRR